jgi:hypothetical protein
MTSADFKTSKQNLCAELSGLRQQNAALADRCAKAIAIVEAQDVEILALKSTVRELTRVSKLNRCTCPCCKDAQCANCKKRLKAEQRAGRVAA